MDEWIGSWLAAWVRIVRLRPRLVLVSALVATVGLGLYAATHLAMNMDTNSIMSQELPGEQRWNEINAAFPETTDPLLIVVDAATSERAREGALALRDRMARETSLFREVDVPGEGPFFEQNGLLYLSTEELGELAGHLATVQPYLAELQRDPSLRGLFDLLNRAVDALGRGETTVFELGPVFDRLSHSIDAVTRDERPTPVSWREVLLGDTIADRKLRLVVAQPIVDYGRLVPAREAIDHIHALAREVGLGPGTDVRVRVTGDLALSTDELTTVMRGALVSGVLSSFAIAGILSLALRSGKLVLATMITLGAGLVWTFAFAAAAIGTLNMVSVAFAVLFVGLGTDFGVHFCLRWQDLRARGRTREAAMEETTADVGLSLVVCSATTAIGFLAFWPTDYNAVAELGLISAVGILVSLFANLTLLPACVELLEPGLPRARARLHDRPFFARLIDLPVRRARAIRIGAVLVALVCLPSLGSVHFSYNPLRLRVQTSDSVAAFDDLMATEGMSPWSVTVLARDPTEARAIADELAALDLVAETVTLANYVPSDQPEKLAILEDVALLMAPPPSGSEELRPPSDDDDISALRRFISAAPAPPGSEESKTTAALARLRRSVSEFLAAIEGADADTRARAIERLEGNIVAGLPEQLGRVHKSLEAVPVSAASLPAELLRGLVAPDGRIRVEAYPREDIAQDDAALRRFVDETQDAVPQAAGIAINAVESARAVVRAFLQALALAAVAIALLLFTLWRRVSDTLIALAPLGLGAAILCALGVALDEPFNFANVLALPALLGIGIDSGIHLVHRWRHADLASGGLLETSSARGVVYSAVTTAASFGSLALSPHPGMASIGFMLTLGLVLILVTNLLLIPALVASRSAARS